MQQENKMKNKMKNKTKNKVKMMITTAMYARTKSFKVWTRKRPTSRCLAYLCAVRHQLEHPVNSVFQWLDDPQRVESDENGQCHTPGAHDNAPPERSLLGPKADARPQPPAVGFGVVGALRQDHHQYHHDNQGQDDDDNDKNKTLPLTFPFSLLTSVTGNTNFAIANSLTTSSTPATVSYVATTT